MTLADMAFQKHGRGFSITSKPLRRNKDQLLFLHIATNPAYKVGKWIEKKPTLNSLHLLSAYAASAAS